MLEYVGNIPWNKRLCGHPLNNKDTAVSMNCKVVNCRIYKKHFICKLETILETVGAHLGARLAG